MRIPVKQVWTGVFNDNYITVQVIDKEEGVVWCNHDGAYEEELDFGQPDSYLCDYVDDWRSGLVCDKCGAWKLSYEEHWQDAPFEGVS